MSDFYFNPYGSDELYHYGVPGMKWGHRKAYPTVGIMLRGNRQMISQPTGSPRTTRSSVNNRNSNNSGNQKQSMSTKKKAAIAATAVVGTALAAYGAYKVSKFIKTKNVQIATEKGKEMAKEYMDSNKMNLKVIQKFKDGTYRVAAKTKYSSSHLSPMNKEQLRSTARDIGEYNAKIMNEANGLRNQTINNAANDNLLSATKNVARYYKKRSRY